MQIGPCSDAAGAVTSAQRVTSCNEAEGLTHRETPAGGVCAPFGKYF